MAHREPRSDGAEKIPFNVMPAEFAEMSKKRIEDCVNAQAELFDNLQASNKQWLARMQSEARLASEFVSRLSAARSIPDTLSACQEWSSRHFEMMAEDGKHFLSDVQKFMKAGSRALSNGWGQDGRNGVGT